MNTRSVMRTVLCAMVLALVGVHAQEAMRPITGDTVYYPPRPGGDLVFLETFDDTWQSRWVESSNPDFTGTWHVAPHDIFVGIPGDEALIVGDAARKHAIAARFPTTLSVENTPMVLQYEVRLQKHLDCGGAYLKLLRAEHEFNVESFDSHTPYVVMFGPDVCGSNNKVHMIIQHRNPVSGAWNEHHLENAPGVVDDNLSHLYTLVLRPDNSFSLRIDQEEVRAGNLLEDLSPPITPPTHMDDPDDLKPADWVDDAMMPDPDAVKPDDWDEDAPLEIVDAGDAKPADWLDDEPAVVPDPDAEQPADWDDEEDGVWEAPLVANPRCAASSGCGVWEPRMVRNPAYKGKWTPPLVENPAYKGEWVPRQVENPFYFVDEHPHNLADMVGVGMELWTMTSGISFDNILVTHDEDVATQFADETWRVRFAEEKRQLDETLRPEYERYFDEGAWGKVKWFVFLVGDVMASNPIAFAIALAVVTMFTLFLCCLPGGDDAAMRADDVAAVDAALAKKDDDVAGAGGEAVEGHAVPADDVSGKSTARADGSAATRRRAAGVGAGMGGDE